MRGTGSAGLGVFTLPCPCCRAKYVDVTLALNTTQFLSQETEYMPWQAALNNLQYFQLMFDRSEVFGVMKVSCAACRGVRAPQTPRCRMGTEGWVCARGWGARCCRCCPALTARLPCRVTSRSR